MFSLKSEFIANFAYGMFCNEL